MKIVFTLPGEPVGKGRPRFSTAGKFPRAYTPEKTASYESLVKLAAARAMAGKPPVSGAVSVSINAFFSIPKSASRERKARMISKDIRPTKKSDADNIAKIICDSLNGIVWHDDAQVVSLQVEKIYAETPMVEVNINAL
ncbi:MAG: RusA family crossover junction endodeoxyribonuclease [Zoogloeaceae bacterium]|jgi:Holliday junction resolvase RusA-like endonuclease|nr:RusA family crossover junction endodeoxyribonuclease [Zoogloeaceae bacterium]